MGPLLLLVVQAATPPAAVPQDIIVVGHRAEKALAECLARKCPPAEDVEASLQASVEQFADARYEDARRTLQRAIDRNRDHAAALPGPVSSLHATLATVAEHEGRPRVWEAAARNNMRVLRQHLGPDHPATLIEALGFADNLIGLKSAVLADRIYRRVQRLAADSGQTELAAGAAFRRAWLMMIRRHDTDARRLADEAVAIAGPGDRQIAELREVLRMQIAVRRGDDGAVDALAARLRQSEDRTPRLLYQMPVDDMEPPGIADKGSSLPIRTADVGYWIRPDGHASEAEVLRTSGLSTWAPAILKQVNGRRYVPLAVEAGHPGIYRIDRFTVRAEFGLPKETRIPGRVGPATVHVVDLTETEAMNAAHRQRSRAALAEQAN